jgi:hypothetical protein
MDESWPSYWDCHDGQHKSIDGSVIRNDCGYSGLPELYLAITYTVNEGHFYFQGCFRPGSNLRKV